MTDEKKRQELDEKALGAATGGKPQHVFVPDVDKIRDMPDAAGGLTEGGDCGGGLDILDDIELERIRGGVGIDLGKQDRRQNDAGEKAEFPWV